MPPTKDKADLWVDERPGFSVLYLPTKAEPVIVLHVIKRAEDVWIVQSSHGAPKGEHPSRESAKKYAEKFAATQVEKTLGLLAELESTVESPTNGWKGTPCGLVVLQVDPHESFLQPDGEVHPEVFEQRRSEYIDKTRANLRGILTSIAR